MSADTEQGDFIPSTSAHLNILFIQTVVLLLSMTQKKNNEWAFRSFSCIFNLVVFNPNILNFHVFVV